jgi:shikimate kinase
VTRQGDKETRRQGDTEKQEVSDSETSVRQKNPSGSPCLLVSLSPCLLVFLIGPRGSGKTTIARLLAGRLGWDCVDADDVLETRYGKSIRAIFAEEGEAGFRNKEAMILAELCGRRRCVVSTGGGVVVRPANRQLLRASGYVVWLTADVETLWRRLQNDDGECRPPLSVGGRAEVEEVLRVRQPWYEECAHVTVYTEGKTPEALAEEIALMAPSGK